MGEPIDPMAVFFEIHSGLPREGPGDAESLARALALVPGLPPRPLVLDLGCGPGTQTLELARRTGGFVIGMDLHLPFLHDLARRIGPERVAAVRGDMARPPFAAGRFDLLWSEGAAYIIGFGEALRAWRPLLKPRAALALTDAVWLKPDPPELARRLWEEYPALTDISANLEAIASRGYEVLGHFTLPEDAWWRHYYTPLAARLPELRRKYAAAPAALEIVTAHELEIEVRRLYGDYYGYEFFVCRRTD